MATELDAMLTRAFKGEKRTEQQKTPPPDGQRDFIKANIGKCTREQLISIFRAIEIDGQGELIKRQTGNNSAVNLDKISDETIHRMYLSLAVILERNNSLIGI